MKIEVWSDFTCPYCYLGKRHLEMAIDQFGHKECITIEYKSFELDPGADSAGIITKNEMLARKYGLSPQKVQEMTATICRQGKEIGLNIHFEQAVHTNTFHAHRLVKYAMKIGKAPCLIGRLFETYFAENANIGDRDVLLGLAEEINMDKTEVETLLCFNKYARTVRNDEQLADELGITSVPFFIFNETHAVVGAQPVDVFMEVLQSLWSEEDEGKGNKQQCTYCVGNECDAE